MGGNSEDPMQSAPGGRFTTGRRALISGERYTGLPTDRGESFVRQCGVSPGGSHGAPDCGELE
jgi:hypothetical protein